MRSLMLALPLFALALAVLLGVSVGHKKVAATASQTAREAQAAQQQPTPADGVRRVTVEELRVGLEKGTAIVVDVRSWEQYKAAHIKGAIWIAENKISDRVKELPKDKLIVTYCSWPSEHTSARAVQDIKAKGYENAGALLGGFAAWERAGLPVEKE